MKASIQEDAKGPAVSTGDLKQIAVDVVRQAIEGGATAAEAVAADGSEFSTTVRLGDVETLKESGSKGIGVRVFLGSARPARTRATSRAKGCGQWWRRRCIWPG